MVKLFCFCPGKKIKVSFSFLQKLIELAQANLKKLFVSYPLAGWNKK